MTDEPSYMQPGAEFPGAFQVIREQLPRFFEEPHTEAMRNVASMFFPQEPADLFLDVALAPVGKAKRLGALALAGMSHSPESDAGVARISKGALAYIRDNWPEALSLSRNALRHTNETGNEYAVVQRPDYSELLTSNDPMMVSFPSETVKQLRTAPAGSMMMHTHPTGDVSPSLADIEQSAKWPNVANLIAAPVPGSPLVDFRRTARPIGKDFEKYVAAARAHIESPQVLDFLEASGRYFPDYTQIEELSYPMAVHSYMRNLGLSGKADYAYNNLGLTDIDPNFKNKHYLADILEDYWKTFIPE